MLQMVTFFLRSSLEIFCCSFGCYQGVKGGTDSKPQACISTYLLPEGPGGGSRQEAGHELSMCTPNPESRMCPGLHQPSRT